MQPLKARQRRLQGIFDEVASRIAETEVKIGARETKMETLRLAALTAFHTDIFSTQPRRTWPKQHLAFWGALPRSILKQLSLADGKPVTTADLASLVGRDLSLQLDENGFSEMKQKIRYRLKALRLRGLVVRASDSKGIGEYATWVIAATAG